MKAISFAVSILICSTAANIIPNSDLIDQGSAVIPSELLYDALFDQDTLYSFKESFNNGPHIRKIAKCFIEHEIERKEDLIKIAKEILKCTNVEKKDLAAYLSNDKTSKKIQFSTSVSVCQTNDSGCIFMKVLEELQNIKKESETPFHGHLSCIAEKTKRLVELIIKSNKHLIDCLCKAGLSCTAPPVTPSEPSPTTKPTTSTKKPSTSTQKPTTSTKKPTTTTKRPTSTTKKHRTTRKPTTTTKKPTTTTERPTSTTKKHTTTQKPTTSTKKPTTTTERPTSTTKKHRTTRKPTTTTKKPTTSTERPTSTTKKHTTTQKPTTTTKKPTTTTERPTSTTKKHRTTRKPTTTTEKPTSTTKKYTTTTDGPW